MKTVLSVIDNILKKTILTNIDKKKLHKDQHNFTTYIIFHCYRPNAKVHDMDALRGDMFVNLVSIAIRSSILKYMRS